MKFESEKQRKVRERQREKKEKEQEEEEIIVQKLRNNSKVVSKKVAEESGNRMFKEAQRRQHKSQSKQDVPRIMSGGSHLSSKNELENYSKYSKNQPYRFQVILTISNNNNRIYSNVHSFIIIFLIFL